MTSAQLVKGWSTLLTLALNDKQGLSSAGQKGPTGVIKQGLTTEQSVKNTFLTKTACYKLNPYMNFIWILGGETQDTLVKDKGSHTEKTLKPSRQKLFYNETGGASYIDSKK